MNLYIVKSGTADNYILAECSDGIRCSNCAPDGLFAGVDISELKEECDVERILSALRNSMDPYLDEDDLLWMGDPILSSFEEWEADNESSEPWAQDHAYLFWDSSVVHDRYKAVVPAGKLTPVFSVINTATGVVDVYKIFRPCGSTYYVLRNDVLYHSFDDRAESESGYISRIIRAKRIPVRPFQSPESVSIRVNPIFSESIDVGPDSERFFHVKFDLKE